jgi:proton-translocating NADH-quinone oxidoreductase chain L
MPFDFVRYVWIIPALPLAALLIILGVTRPLDVRQRRRLAVAHEGAQPGGAPSGAHGASHDVGASGGHPSGAHEDREVDHLHDAHEATTPGWAALGGWIGTLAMGIAFIYSLLILAQFLGSSTLQHNGFPDAHLSGTAHDPLLLFNWVTFGNLSYSIDFRVDTLTVIMLVVVTAVSFLVQLYSVGYMAGEPGFSRFYIELSLFTLSMLILVLAANFLTIFIGWEGVGLCSYLLVGFWYERTAPPPAALKAFVTTRFGDFGFLIGILVLFFATGTFNFTQLNTATRQVDQFTITLAMILVFCGAVGKSAQFPLHVWLPDAMEGPTPVSALIHAATMVAAGVYLVARLFPIYASVAGPQSLLVVGYVGGFTALFAATIALVQTDIKRVLAYSTVSQLGYMFVGLAVADTNSVGIFHLFTHAFFKALLFLGSGSVIIALHHTQDMREMGGLARRMPITAATFLIAALSISGFPMLAGFFSKDAIISKAYEYGTAHGGNYVLYGMTLATAFLTAFYMFRLFYLTFGGRGARFLGLWGGDAQYRGTTPARESPWTMAVPLLLLAIPAALAGYWAFSFDGSENFGTFLNNGQTLTFANPFTDTLTWIGVGVALAGIALAWLMYGTPRVVISPAWYQRVPFGLGTAVYTLLVRKYYLDELYLWLIHWIVLGLSNAAAWFDAVIIDGVVNGSARFVLGLGSITRRSETGRVQSYAGALFAGALVLALALIISATLLAVK